LEGIQAEKKRKYLQPGQVARGSGQLEGDQGGGNGGGVAAEVLAGWLVLNKSKTNCAPCLLVLFYVAANLFCTVGSFAPWPELAGMLEEGRRMGCQAGGLAGLYPPLHLYSWDDKWF